MYGLDLGMKSGKEFLEYISTLIEHGERYPRLKVEPTYVHSFLYLLQVLGQRCYFPSMGT
jgi:hypothetical protein